MQGWFDLDRLAAIPASPIPGPPARVLSSDSRANLRRAPPSPSGSVTRKRFTHWISRAYAEGWAVGMFNAHPVSETTQAIAATQPTGRTMLSTTWAASRHVGLDYFVMAEVARRRVPCR